MLSSSPRPGIVANPAGFITATQSVVSPRISSASSAAAAFFFIHTSSSWVQPPRHRPAFPVRSSMLPLLDHLLHARLLRVKREALPPRGDSGRTGLVVEAEALLVLA